jgi:hypothetical protein
MKKLNCKQVACMLQMTIDKFYYMRKSGKFLPHHIDANGDKYWLEQDVLDWIRAKEGVVSIVRVDIRGM